MPDADKIVSMLVESGSLVEKDDRGRIHASISSFDYRRYDVSATAITRTDMSAEAARAAIEIARNTHVVPAEERTKRELIRSRSEQLKAIVTGVCVLSGILGVVFASEGKAPSIAIIVSVVGGLYAVREIVKSFKKRAEDEGEDA
ncbi:hypothetical protein [Sorangium sp. So ce1389]|uniref:hypothetical protein n=1 Tax=Sorangium sp. So ce1389 TaxID=3133336 RepID=UPI003F646ADF